MTTQERNEWLEKRRAGIGSSDIGAIAGYSVYAEALDVYREKVENHQDEENIFMLRGRILEDAIAEMFEAETGFKTRKPKEENYYHKDFPEKPFMATPDFYFEDDTKEEQILETKSMRGYLTGSKEEDVNESYYCQIQWQMHVTGIKKATICILDSSLWIKYYTFEYDEEFAMELERKGLDFWNNHVLTKTPPEPNTKRANEILYPEQEEGLVIEADDEIPKTYDKLIEARTIRKELEEKEEKLKNKIACYMKDAETVEYAGKKLATYKTNKNGSRVLLIK